MTTTKNLQAIGHEFAISAISATTSGASKQQLVLDYIKPLFDGLESDLKGDCKISTEVGQIVNTIIDETTAAGKDAKNTAVRDFKIRINRALEKLGQENKRDTTYKVGIKTTGKDTIVSWEPVELYYGKDEEGNIDKSKPMTKAAHTKKYGTGKDEGADDSTVELDEGEKRIVLNVTTEATLATSILDVCKAHGLDPLKVAESMLDKVKPKLNPQHFTLAAEKLAATAQGIDWAQAYHDNGGKLNKVDVQAIIDSQAA